MNLGFLIVCDLRNRKTSTNATVNFAWVGLGWVALYFPSCSNLNNMTLKNFMLFFIFLSFLGFFTNQRVVDLGFFESFFFYSEVNLDLD